MQLSIIIPVYNAEAFIEKCILSITKQTKDYSDIELIVVNDGSTDNSLEILKSLSLKHNQINLFDQKNEGEGFTRNLGLEKSTGKYIWFIDADDYIDGNIVDKIHNILKIEQPEIIIFGMKRVTFSGTILSKDRFSDNTLTPEQLMNKSIYNNSVCNKIISANLIKSNNLQFNPKVKTATDFDFSFRILFLSKKIITLQDVCYNYLVNQDSISNIRTTAHLERIATDSVIVGNNIRDFLNSYKIDLPDRVKIFQKWFNNYLYGLMLSLYRFNYNNQFIIEIIENLKKKGNYPINTKNMTFKKKIFMLIANNKLLFLFACKYLRKV